MEIQLTLVKSFGWSLSDIDRTDAVSLFDFIRHVAQKTAPKQVFAEDVDW